MADETKVPVLSSIKSKVLMAVGIVGAVLVVGGLIFVIVWLATKNKTIVFHPEVKVTDIENTDKPVSQKTLDSAISVGQSIYNKINGITPEEK
jgi:hypothetical protein